MELLSSLDEVVFQSDCILSIVPPQDALRTAQRVAEGLRNRALGNAPLYFLDLNAISPQRAREIADIFTGSVATLTLIDGSIIGFRPRLIDSKWKRPAVITSGPVKLPDNRLSDVLNVRHVGTEIGAASGLKMCFASLTKGLTAIVIQSFTTAYGLGNLEGLCDLMREYNPVTLDFAERNLARVPSTAYRWEHEMREIGDTFHYEGFEKHMFYGAAEVYRMVAEDSILGQGNLVSRDNLLAVEDATKAIHKAVSRKRKTD